MIPRRTNIENPQAMSEGRTDTHGWILMLLGVAMTANALWMLGGPMHWYAELPAAVPDTGPFNPHFVRDIGCAFLTCGVGLIWAARSLRYRLPLSVIATLFLLSHALLHIYDTAVGNLPHSHWKLDFAGVYLPAIILSWIVVRNVRAEMN
jgi:hypothetical protein